MPPRVFLDWTHPLLPALTAWLLAQSTLPGAPDLAHVVVVLPTSESGRRLRESLALAAGDTGLLSPVIITPEVLLTWSTENLPGLAERGETIAAWAAVLLELHKKHQRQRQRDGNAQQRALARATQRGAAQRRRRRVHEKGR
jgi:hypothetical protein